MTGKAVLVDRKGFFKTVEVPLSVSWVSLEPQWPADWNIMTTTMSQPDFYKACYQDQQASYKKLTFKIAEPVPGYESYARFYREVV